MKRNTRLAIILVAGLLALAATPWISRRLLSGPAQQLDERFDYDALASSGITGFMPAPRGQLQRQLPAADGSSDTGAFPPRPLSPDESERMAQLRDIGVNEDAAGVDRLKEALGDPLEQLRLGALWSLARLRCQEALPAIDDLTRPQPGWSVGDATYARVVGTQIRATASGPARGARTLRRQMRQVLGGAGLSAAKAAAVIRRDDDEGDHERLCRARFALEQLADMALVASRRGIAGAADASPVDLSLPGVSWAKAELSRHPRQEGIRILVDELAGRSVERYWDDETMQALSNEGAAAKPVIFAKLNAMRQAGTYKHIGYTLLFRTLEGIGGQDAAAAVARFRDDPDHWVRGDADEAYQVLATGKRCRLVVPF